jgi:hypothetical protein
MNNRDTRRTELDEAPARQAQPDVEPVAELGDRERELGRVAEALTRR